MIEQENTISSDLIYTGKTISLRVDTVEVPNKGYQKREIVEHNGTVGIVALTEDNEVMLIKQYRKSIEDMVLEIPSGKLELNENPKECAIRELKEKTGYIAENLKLIHKFYSSVEFSNEMVFIYLATKLSKDISDIKENDNVLDIVRLNLDEIHNKIYNNEIADAKTSLSLLLIKDIVDKN